MFKKQNVSKLVNSIMEQILFQLPKAYMDLTSNQLCINYKLESQRYMASTIFVLKVSYIYFLYEVVHCTHSPVQMATVSEHVKLCQIVDILLWMDKKLLFSWRSWHMSLKSCLLSQIVANIFTTMLHWGNLKKADTIVNVKNPRSLSVKMPSTSVRNERTSDNKVH